MSKAKPLPIKFAVAPMLDWTDRHCRYFYRLMTKKALLYTEMINVQAVVFGNRDALLSFNECEHPIAIQLGGSDLSLFPEAAKICYEYGYDEINLNVGCPSPRVQSGSFGACLMQTPKHVGDIVAAMKASVPIPITVKCRIGVDHQDCEESLDKFGAFCKNANVDAFWVHARKAWLKGLSPKENRSVPPLNYDRVYRFKKKFNDDFVGINGGITSLEEALEHLKYVDAVMMGREIYQNPSLLKEVDEKIYFDEKKTLEDKFILEEMERYCANHIENGGHLAQVTRHIMGLFKGKNGAKQWRQFLSKECSKRTAKASCLKDAFKVAITNINE